jgi:predicted nucleic acid-binding Zn ribbon protein
MERAARLFKDKRLSRELMTDEDIVRAAWACAVGKSIASHTSRLRLVRETLVVEVEDAVWQKQLYALSKQILGRLAKFTGNCQITDIEFRVAIPRRQIQRVESSNPDLFHLGTSSADEAEAIHDPVLKKVYQLSRKKVGA